MEDRYVGLQVVALILCLLFTATIYGQRQTSQGGGVIVQSTPGVSQETRDALQDARIVQIVAEQEVLKEIVKELREKMTNVDSALQRLNTTGYTFGALLSFLLGVDLYFRLRNSILAKLGQK